MKKKAPSKKKVWVRGGAPVKTAQQQRKIHFGPLFLKIYIYIQKEKKHLYTCKEKRKKGELYSNQQKTWPSGPF